MSRWCLAVSHGLPKGWFLVWRCVLHGRVSSFFRASESSVRQFFCGAVLAGLGSCLGGVWLFRIWHGLPRGWFLVWRCVLQGRVSSFFRASESSVRQFFCGAVLAGLGSCLGGVWLFRMGCREVGLEVLDKATAWFCLVGFHLSLWFCTVEFHLSLGHQKAT